MQQRQLRLGDILDDYCPRERRITNHAVVAMIGSDVKQTRCITCDAEHAYKHARLPRQRKKSDVPAALYAHASVPVPKKAPEQASPLPDASELSEPSPVVSDVEQEWQTTGEEHSAETADLPEDEGGVFEAEHQTVDVEDGPVHRPLIRATLPRPEGQAPPTRQAPEFTIRQPGGRGNRFRPRQWGGAMFQGNRSGNATSGSGRTGYARQQSGRPQGSSRASRRHGPGRKRSK